MRCTRKLSVHSFWPYSRGSRQRRVADAGEVEVEVITGQRVSRTQIACAQSLAFWEVQPRKQAMPTQGMWKPSEATPQGIGERGLLYSSLSKSSIRILTVSSNDDHMRAPVSV